MIMTSMTIKNINTAVTGFLIEHGEIPSSHAGHETLYNGVKSTLPEGTDHFTSFYEIMCDFINAFGPVMDSLIHNLDQLEEEDRVNCERAIKALWNGDDDTQNRLSKLCKKKVSDKPTTKPKARKNDPAKFFKKIGPGLRKAVKKMKEKKRKSPQVIFKDKVTPELKKAVKELNKKRTSGPRVIFKKKVTPELKKAVKELKKRKIDQKKAERETKKAEREAKKAERESEKEPVVEDSDKRQSDSESDQESSSNDDEEALRRIKSARPDLTDDGARILLEKFKSKLSIKN